MARLLGTAILLILLLVAAPVRAVKEIIKDFDTGEITESVEAPPPEMKNDLPAADREAAETAGLKRIIREQQRVLRQQQAIIEGQREEIRRQQDINRGLELLCRACR